MKYILPSIGAIIGVFVFSLFGGDLWPYPGAFLGALVGTVLLVALSRRLGPALSNSKKLGSKELLAADREESFSSWSLAQLKDLKKRLGENGLIKHFDERNFSCSVADSWQGLAESEKIAFCHFGYHYCLKASAENDKGYFIVHVPKGDCSDAEVDENYVYVTSRRLLSAERPLLPRFVGHVNTIVDVDHCPREETIKSLISECLSPIESKIIRMYYFENMSEEEIGSKLGLSKAEVSQIRVTSKRRLQDQLSQHKEGRNETSSDSVPPATL